MVEFLACQNQARPTFNSVPEITWTQRSLRNLSSDRRYDAYDAWRGSLDSSETGYATQTSLRSMLDWEMCMQKFYLRVNFWTMTLRLPPLKSPPFLRLSIIPGITLPFLSPTYTGNVISPCAQSGYKNGPVFAADYATSFYLDTNTARSITIGQMVTPRRDRRWFWVDCLCCR
jgi:hypothetical protein